MVKLLTILLVALAFEAVGVVFLNRGLKELGGVGAVSVTEVAKLVQRGATNPNLVVGVLCETIFFAGLLVLMARADVSFIWPLTSLGFVFTTLAARFILHETVSGLRWSGVMLIMIGAALITWSERHKPAEPSGVAAVAGSPAEPPSG